MFMARKLSFLKYTTACLVNSTQRAVTPYMMATSEIRRTDRRGATPDHVLYIAMKMLRTRVVEVDSELHSILDDSQKDLFCNVAPAWKTNSVFTISANEIKWPKLLKILHGLSDSFKDIHVEDPLVNLNRYQRSHLVNEDPHRGSPHAHVLLRLENDPHEKISENMPKTIQLLTDLCSVSCNDLPGELYANQVHKHTFTCMKRGETSCRFGIPYWPMMETRVLLPLPKDDRRKNGLQTRATKLRKLLEEKNYETLGEFLVDNNLTMAHYLDTIRATLRRPTVVFKCDLSEIYTNTFNPWIARTVCANSDLQFILEESTAAQLML
ncbi:helitron_like_N domain-containing protein [Trichonephila clavipes]|nr:helitron_like_N domain-containing protein [Trichonephila clavipes]